MTLSRVLRMLVITSAVAVLLICVAAVFLPFFAPFERIIPTALVAMLAIGAALVCALVRDTGIMSRRMVSGVITSLVTGMTYVLLIWWPRIFDLPPQFLIPIMAGGSWASLMALTGLLALPKPRARWWMVLRHITVISLYVASAATVIGTVLWPEVSPFWTLFGYVRPYQMASLLARVGGMMSLITGGMVLTTFLTMWLTPPTVDDAVRLPVSLCCPRCETQHNRQTGDARCEHCGLRIRVLVS